MAPITVTPVTGNTLQDNETPDMQWGVLGFVIAQSGMFAPMAVLTQEAYPESTLVGGWVATSAEAETMLPALYLEIADGIAH